MIFSRFSGSTIFCVGTVILLLSSLKIRSHDPVYSIIFYLLGWNIYYLRLEKVASKFWIIQTLQINVVWAENRQFWNRVDKNLNVKSLVDFFHVLLEHEEVHDDNVLEVDVVLQTQNRIVFEQEDVGQKRPLVKLVQQPKIVQPPKVIKSKKMYLKWKI